MTHHTGSHEGRVAELLAEVLRTHHAEVSIEDGVPRSWRCSALDWSSDVPYGDGSQFATHVAAIQADALAARAAAPDALRERMEALARELDEDADEAAEIGAESRIVVDLQVSLRRMAADKIRAALAERPTDGAGT